MDYESEMLEKDWRSEGVLTIGEAATEQSFVAAGFKGDVFVLNGRQDMIFCGDGFGEGDCGKEGREGASQKTGGLYPNARRFGSWNLENTRHDWNLHYSAKEGFEKAHVWLEATELHSL